MKKILLTLVGAISFAAVAQAQPASTVDLTNMGGFNNTYSYVRTDVVSGSDGNTYNNYVYSAGPTVMTGIPQFSMTIYENQATGERFLASLGDRQAPWLPTATIAWESDGTRKYATGYAADLDESTYSIAWDGGGMGPGFASAGVSTATSTEDDGHGGLFYKVQAEAMNEGLDFQNGEWTLRE